MIQIVKYEVVNNILTVGFKVENFVVYSSIGYDSKKQKPQLLQLAYEKIKKSIDYEKTLSIHTFTTDKIGERFIPQIPIVKSINIKTDKNVVEFTKNDVVLYVPFNIVALDQYGEVFNGIVVTTTSHGSINSNVLAIPFVDEEIVVTLTVKSGNITTSKIIEVIPYIEEITQEDPIINVLNRINDLDALSVNTAQEVGIIKDSNDALSSSVNQLHQNSLDLTYVLDLDFRLSMLELGL